MTSVKEIHILGRIESNCCFFSGASADIDTSTDSLVKFETGQTAPCLPAACSSLEQQQQQGSRFYTLTFKSVHNQGLILEWQGKFNYCGSYTQLLVVVMLMRVIHGGLFRVVELKKRMGRTKKGVGVDIRKRQHMKFLCNFRFQFLNQK